MGVLRSALFTTVEDADDPKAFERLEACAVRDSAHVVFRRDSPPETGKHVKRIQEALAILGFFPREAINSTYDSSTADAVFEYKSSKSPKILGPGQTVPDAIVGKQTIRRLDDDLARTPRVEPAPEKKTIDIIVKFVGVFGLIGENRFEGDPVLRSEALEDYEGKHPGRKLVRVGHTTASIEADAQRIVTRILDEINFVLKDNTPGKIMILGSSSGGRVALDLAVRLTGQGTPLEYVAPIDAAFFPNSPQLTNKPTEVAGHSDVVPLLQMPGINAARRECFFQTLGNRAKLSVTQGRQFTSDMAGGEIHGNVIGFTPVNLDDKVKARAGARASADSFHAEAAAVATPEAEQTIVRLLGAL